MRRRLLAILTVMLIAVAAGPAVATATVPPTDPPAVVDNEFIPENRDLADCVSAIPKPGCGSEARGGWRQALVFGVVVAGLAVVGWRITKTVRRNRELLESGRGR